MVLMLFVALLNTALFVFARMVTRVSLARDVSRMSVNATRIVRVINSVDLIALAEIRAWSQRPAELMRNVA